ncbi:hypothetical protein ABZS92_42405, partial [Streptomyces sp. NPDC005444]|uniref:hypothetical protein n=1 Tax=Streptomyces sp. NPDC005444 TaxID=3156881 RepID=UPI0033BF45A3
LVYLTAMIKLGVTMGWAITVGLNSPAGRHARARRARWPGPTAPRELHISSTRLSCCQFGYRIAPE